MANVFAVAPPGNERKGPGCLWTTISHRATRGLEGWGPMCRFTNEARKLLSGLWHFLGDSLWHPVTPKRSVGPCPEWLAPTCSALGPSPAAPLKAKPKSQLLQEAFLIYPSPQDADCPLTFSHLLFCVIAPSKTGPVTSRTSERAPFGDTWICSGQGWAWWGECEGRALGAEQSWHAMCSSSKAPFTEKLLHTQCPQRWEPVPCNPLWRWWYSQCHYTYLPVSRLHRPPMLVICKGEGRSAASP